MSQTKSDSEGGSTPDSSFVSVDIYDQTYHLSGPDPVQIQRLAARVDACMRSVASASRTADSLRVAVLAALNFADEAACAEEKLQQLGATREAAESAELHSRAMRLRGLLDTVLQEDSQKAS